MRQIRLLTIIAACIFATAAIAQQNAPAKGEGHTHAGPGMGNIDDHVKQLSTKLNLSADQQTQVKTILEDHQQQIEALMKDSSISKDDKHAKMEGLHDSVHSKVREILTDEQKPKFDAMVKEMAEKHAHGGDKDHK